MEEKKKDWKYWLNNFESYIAAALFLAMLMLLTLQVVTRYFFNHAITWAEELATNLFVLMIYCSISAAVTWRKHVSIDALLEVVPFRIKKVLLILGDLIFFAFCLYVQPALFQLITQLGTSVTPLLRMAKKNIYIWIPVFLLLTAVRLIQDIIRLAGETEEHLGETIPTLPLEEFEREARLAGKLPSLEKMGEEEAK